MEKKKTINRYRCMTCRRRPAKDGGDICDCTMMWATVDENFAWIFDDMGCGSHSDFPVEFNIRADERRLVLETLDSPKAKLEDFLKSLAERLVKKYHLDPEDAIVRSCKERAGAAELLRGGEIDATDDTLSS